MGWGGPLEKSPRPASRALRNYPEGVVCEGVAERKLN